MIQSSPAPTDDGCPHADVEWSPRPAGGRAATSVKVEANFLRFPLFALSTKGLKSLDGIECRGQLRRGGVLQDYVLRATRNTASLYPGPLARRVHFALLGIATERGLPIQNPVTWTWRDLCRRMGIAYGGRTTLAKLKAAIRSIHGVVLHTEGALFSRPDGRPLATVERGYHLYAEYTFKNEPKPDGGATDANAIWFADWYLANLNALFAAPLDYDRWQVLDQKSPIASRLYEFLVLNFHSGTPVLRINYANLAQLLPVQAMPYPSAARKQMGPALDLLVRTGLLARYAWEVGRGGQLVVRFAPGGRLRSSGRPAPDVAEALDDAVVVRELHNDHPPAWFLVRDFYRLWGGGELARPSAKELSLAEQLIAEHGQTRAVALVAKAVRQLKVRWPDAKTFGAVARYLPDAVRELDREEHFSEQQRVDVHAAESDDRQRQERLARREQLRRAWKPRWDALSRPEQDEIRAAVSAAWPHDARVPIVFERRCLEELARRSEAGETAPPV